MPRRREKRTGLTTKDKLWVQAYIKHNCDGNAATREVCNCSTEGSVRTTTWRMLIRSDVMKEIERVSNRVLDDKEALIESVLAKLKSSFEEAKHHRDIDKLGRTLLEVAGQIGGKAHTTVNVNTVNFSNVPTSELESLEMKLHEEMLQRGVGASFGKRALLDDVEDFRRSK